MIPTHCPHSPDGYCTECTRLAVAVAETLVERRDAEKQRNARQPMKSEIRDDLVRRALVARVANDAALAAYRAARAKEQA